MNTNRWFILILAVTLLLGVFTAFGNKLGPQELPGPVKKIADSFKITLGIDLVGGAELTYRILYKTDKERDDEQTKPTRVIDIIRKRIQKKKLLGEPRITQMDKDQFVIQIAVHDQEKLNEYKELLNQVGQLEEREVASKEITDRWKSSGKVPEGWTDDPDGDGKKLEMLVSKDVVITGKDIKYAGKSRSLEGGWQVDINLTDEGAKKFDAAASRLFEQDPKGRTAILLDGKLVSAPTINAKQYNGTMFITRGGGFPEKEADDLAVVLSSGQLPVPIGRRGPGDAPIRGEPEGETFIGPTLAQDSLARGLAAAGVGLALVILFMFLYYRGSGLVAIYTLLSSLIYLASILGLFNADLTLPGLAGLVLTIGMAVDANIIILERIREEMAKGKTSLQAFESGHEKALSTIVDANVTTLIAAGVLYYAGTGPVKNFAMILGLGIVTTIFSVLVVGKILTKLLIQAGTLREFRMMTFWKGRNVNFIRMMPACVILSIVAVVGAIAVFSKRVDQSLGPDFRGGTRLSFRLNDNREIGYVRDKVYAIKGPDGKALIPGAEVTAMAEEEGATATKFQIFAKPTSRIFQLRSSTQDQDLLRREIQAAFQDEMSHVPLVMVPRNELPKEDFFEVAAEDNKRYPPGGGYFLYFHAEKFDLSKATAAIKDAMKELGFTTSSRPEDPTNVKIDEASPAPKGLRKVRVLFAQPDWVRNPEAPAAEPEKITAWRQKFEKLAHERKIPLTESPFLSSGRIGPAVAEDLVDRTVWALIIGWFLIIIYIAIRFTSWKFGLAAVIALIHDALIAVGVVALAGWVVPKSWGLSFEMNVVTVAALLTIIGYSVNDTIVLFDRIRENTLLMKRDTFRDIVNASVNQTMSRTILTAFTTFIVVIVLYAFTMTSAGGVAEFAFPLIVGIIVGTYSSIYVASAIVVWFFRHKKPQMAK